jgi:urea carboxylase
MPQWTALDVPAGAVLKLGAIRGAGMRAYILVRGGVAAAEVMGSRSAFTPARLGGGPLRKGDVLPVGPPPTRPVPMPAAIAPPAFGNTWTLRVIGGPHGAPDLLTPAGLDELLAATWSVHHHSDRTGVRLVGPVPEFAREDGGEAGLHASNILDSAYGVGTLMLAGDMAVAVGPDGPSLGGFVAFAQVVRDDLWMLGQLRAGDDVRLQPVSAPDRAPTPVLDGPRESAGGLVTYRRAGERALLVEFGEPALDLRARVRAHQLQGALRDAELTGALDLTPGVRSLHITLDPDRTSPGALLEAVARIEATLPAPDDVVVPARAVQLPLAWRHSEAMLAIERYAASVRADAPWCPDNIEFIRRINGLEDEEAVRRIVTEADYLVLGLGDVYLGAPVAVPLDPRHRLVTTKYNPARTWTPANAVGIGGAFLCVYGMEGPGGYQLVGRTVPIWHGADDPPWRLRHFDQLRFSLVAQEELEELRRASMAGDWAPPTEPVVFSLAAHEAFLREHAEEIATFRARREAAFATEREAWAAAAWS